MLEAFEHNVSVWSKIDKSDQKYVFLIDIMQIYQAFWSIILALSSIMDFFKRFEIFCLISENSSFLGQYNAILSPRTHFMF